MSDFNFKSVRDFAIPRPHAFVVRTADKITYSVSENTKTNRFSATLRFGTQVLEEAGLVIGDIVEVLVDADHQMLLVRKSDKGFKLVRTDPKLKTEEIAGTVKRAQVIFTVNPGMGIDAEKVASTEVDFQLQDGAILIKLPAAPAVAEETQELAEAA